MVDTCNRLSVCFRKYMSFGVGLISSIGPSNYISDSQISTKMRVFPSYICFLSFNFNHIMSDSSITILITFNFNYHFYMWYGIWDMGYGIWDKITQKWGFDLMNEHQGKQYYNGTKST